MPLMIYVGGTKEGRRSKDAKTRRATRAAERGWGKEKIEAERARRKLEEEKGGEHGTPAVAGTNDGQPSAVKGKGTNDGQPSAVTGTSGKGGGAGWSGKGWRQSNAYTS